MKLRFGGNFIRLRLGQSEVCRLATEGMIDQCTDFGPSSAQRFCYELHASFEEPHVSATFANGRLVVTVPADAIHQWARTDQVSIDAQQRIADGSELRILIEKDFRCMNAAPEEREEDAFPHPQFNA